MRCEKVRELLKSDYFDGESTPEEQRSVSEHLKLCPGCCELEKELQAQRAALILQSQQLPVPDAVWQNIRNSLASLEPASPNKVTDIIERLKALLFFPKPAFALAGALTVIIITGVFMGNLAQRKAFFYNAEKEQILSDYSLNGDNDDAVSGFGTALEEYFL